MGGYGRTPSRIGCVFGLVRCGPSAAYVNLIVPQMPAATGNPPAATWVARCVVNFSPFLFPIIQRRHGNFGMFCVGVMHRLGIVPQRLLRERVGPRIVTFQLFKPSPFPSSPHHSRSKKSRSIRTGSMQHGSSIFGLFTRSLTG